MVMCQHNCDSRYKCLTICWEILRQSHFPASDESEVAGHPHKELLSLGLYTITNLHSSNSPMDEWRLSLLAQSKIYLLSLSLCFPNGPEINKERGRNL